MPQNAQILAEGKRSVNRKGDWFCFRKVGVGRGDHGRIGH